MFLEFLYPLHEHPGLGFLNVFRYITFRSAYAAVFALFLALVLGRPVIAWLRRFRIGQKIREEGPQGHQVKAGTPTMTTVPFLKFRYIDLGILYVPFVALVITGSSNAVNLTDGLDGLATGLVIFAALTFAGFAYVSGHVRFSEYLNILYLPEAGELTVFCAALVGASLGFLWFNCHPADVFMGDTGSLALGGALGTVAILLKRELLLIVVGGVFVAEALSVMIQVLSFKLTGKRVFRMAPLHHHFELAGWPESRVVTRFYIVAALLSLVSLSTLKLQ